METLIRRRASGLGLNCLPLSQKKDARLKGVNQRRCTAGKRIKAGKTIKEINVSVQIFIDWLRCDDDAESTLLLCGFRVAVGGCVFFFVPATVVFVVDALEVGNRNSVMSFSVVVLFCVCAARYHVIQNVIRLQTYKQTNSTQSLLGETRLCNFE